MLNLITFGHPLWVAALAVVVVVGYLLRAGIWVIREYESGLVIKKFGQSLPPGRLIAQNGEAGYQADLLPPGWHFGLWRWKYRVDKVPMLTVRPGEIALVVANDGDAIPSERILGQQVECDDFQNSTAFLANGGEKGRQLAFLTAGTYRINPALFQLVTTDNADQFGMRARISPYTRWARPRSGSSMCWMVARCRRVTWLALRSRGTTTSSAGRRSSRPVGAADCRSRCCCPARGT